MEGKKTLGRRKIPMQKIESKPNLLVAFSKRRMSLFKKAADLSVVSRAEIALLVQSPAGKIFAFGNPSVESILGRFQMGEGYELGANCYWDAQIRARESYERGMYMEGMKKLEREKEKGIRMKEIGGTEYWLDKAIEGMGVEELEEFAEAMEVLKAEVEEKLRMTAETTSHCRETASQRLACPDELEQTATSGGCQKFLEICGMDFQLGELQWQPLDKL